MTDRNKIVLETENVRVRIMALEGGQATAWHYHTEVTDSIVCLVGPVAVEYRNPDERIELVNGEYRDVPVKRVHRVVNLTMQAARYLLVQGVGCYDFNVAEE
jgi:quercetin dioxygenase-like cupin family protein